MFVYAREDSHLVSVSVIHKGFGTAENIRGVEDCAGAIGEGVVLFVLVRVDGQAEFLPAVCQDSASSSYARMDVYDGLAVLAETIPESF